MQLANAYTGVVPDELSTPLELRTVEAFLNTVDERSFSQHGVPHSGGDVLTTSRALATWLVGQGLAGSTTRVGRADLAAAIALRTALRLALTLRSGQSPASGAWSAANAALEEFPLRLALGHDGALHLGAASAGVRGALAIILADVARAEARGTWDRLRVCAAPDCRWVFYDNSRNGAGRWCSMAACGNRDKTRRYRERVAARQNRTRR